MIVLQLTGGLGNQMFQYALGRVLSLKHNSELLFDISSFDYQPYTDTKRAFELAVYKVRGTIAKKSMLNRRERPNRYKIILNQYLHLGLNPYPKNYVKENGHEFHLEVLKSPDNTYLSGFWQSENYFRDIRNTIIDDFSKRASPISSRNAELKSDMTKSESVSLHVRRTDYVTNPNANAFHGICDIAYYQRAMKHVEKAVKKPVYYVFSDDPDWAKENIKSKHKMIYISHNHGRDAHEDIRLMSTCRHNIIANSSFSWWGAWLNQNPQKIVMSPKTWFKDRSVNTKDMIPTEWVRL